jgi:formate dehydrogenase
MQVGTVGVGRIGSAVLRRLSRSRLGCSTPTATASRTRSRRIWEVTYHVGVEEMVGVCDVVTINAPLHPETENLSTTSSSAR